jgi:hypothetical protein
LTSVGFGLTVPELPSEAWPEPPGRPLKLLRWEWESIETPRETVASVVEGADWCTLTWPSEGEYHLGLGADPRVSCRSWGVTPEEAARSVAMWLIPAALPLIELEPLHGAAGAQDGAGVLLLGDSGAGKTTLALELEHRGLAFLADDVCALDASGRLHAGVRLRSVQMPSSDMDAVAPYDGKWLVRVAGRAPSEAVPARHALVLEPREGRDLAITPLRGAHAFRALMKHIRRPTVFTERRAERQLSVVAGLSEQHVGELSFDRRAHSPGQVAELVSEWIRRAA